MLNATYGREVHIVVVAAPTKAKNIKDFAYRKATNTPRRLRYTYRGVIIGKQKLLRRRVAAYTIITMLPKYRSSEHIILVGRHRAKVIKWDLQTRIAQLEVTLRTPRKIVHVGEINRNKGVIFWSDEEWRFARFIEDGREYKVRNEYGGTNDSLLPGTPVYQEEKLVGLIWQVDDLYIRMLPVL